VPIHSALKLEYGLSAKLATSGRKKVMGVKNGGCADSKVKRLVYSFLCQWPEKITAGHATDLF
jgi:hypothetical protein